MSRELSRIQLLTAEIHNYSYDNYYDHLGIGNVRFEKIMPNVAKTLERAARENWSLERTAKKLDIDIDKAQNLLEAYHEALEIIDAEDPSESFRAGVRHSIERAIKKGLGDPDSIENLVRQICYRTADLSFLLAQRDVPLSRYSRHLRKEPDTEYYDGYFDEE
ncbi:hypothetical protein ACFLU6_07610 [Acidobacteriota bacterium]